MSRIVRKAPHGLPEALPAGETILWQGSPEPWAMARGVFHVRGLAAYFAALLVGAGALGVSRGTPAAEIAGNMAWLAGIGFAALALCAGLAVLYARTTIYTLTNRRLVMRYGAALPATLNLPFRRIVSAAANVKPDGSADIPLVLEGDTRIAYLHLWPHVRPWRLSKPEPMLRAVPDGARVATLLSRALADAAGTVPVAAVQAVEAPSLPAATPVAA